MIRSLGTHRALVIIGLALAACSSDRATGPDNLPPEGGPYDGTWVLSWGAVTGDAASCRLPSFTLALHQYGDSVDGTYSSHGDLACLRDGLLYAAPPGSGRTGGHLGGDTLQFSFSLPLFQTHATAHDSTLTGVLKWLVAFSSTQTAYSVLTGAWTAHRIPGPATPDSAADIELYPGLPALIGGDSGQLADTVRNADGQVLPSAAVTFSTSDPGTATVEPNGVLTARGGALRLFSVIARSGRAYTDAVGINIPGAARVVVSPATLAMSRYHIAQLTTQVFDSIGELISYVTPTYAVQPTGVVTLTNAGEVTASGTLGSANVIVQAGSAKATVPVSVVSIPTGFTVTPDSGGLIAPHDSLRMTATVVDSEGLQVPGTTVTYTSSNPTVLSVSSSGLIQSSGADGFADITASSGTYTATRRFLVRSGPVPGIVATEQLGGDPFSAAIGPTGALYIGDGSGGGLYRGNLPSFDLSDHQAWNASLKSIAFDSFGHRAFVGLFGSSQVAVMDADSNRVVDSINVGDGLTAVAVSPGGSKLLVGTSTAIHSFDAHSLAPLDTVIGYGATHFSFDSIQSRAYATISGGVEELDLSTLHQLRTWSVPGAEGTAVSPDDSELYVAVSNAGMRVINLNSGQLEPLVSLPGLYDIKILPSADLIVADGIAGGIFVLDRGSRILIARLPVAGYPRRMAVDPTGKLIVEANEAGWVDFIQ